MNALIPNHPGFVHFPLALLAAAFFFELMGLAFRKPALHDIGRANLFLGTAAVLVAVGTGLWGQGLVTPRPHALDALMDRHENLAFVVASGAVVLTMWRIALRKKYAGGTRTLYVALLGALAALTLLTGHLGGQMVYDHGAGVTLGRRSFGSKGLPAESLPRAADSSAAKTAAGR